MIYKSLFLYLFIANSTLGPIARVFGNGVPSKIKELKGVENVISLGKDFKDVKNISTGNTYSNPKIENNNAYMKTIEDLSEHGEKALKAEQANNARNQFSPFQGKDLDYVRKLVQGNSIESQSTLIVMNQLLMGNNLSAAADKELVIDLMKWMKGKSSTDELIKLLKDNEGMKETFGGNEKVILQSIKNMYNKVHSTLTQGTKDRSYTYEPLKIEDDKGKNDITLETLNIPYLDKNTYNKVLRGLSEAEIENKKLRDKEKLESAKSYYVRKIQII
ncbi:hypothetical protein [Campylobacter fetus]|uniref:hypothetical protein n=1 Tax=Campylobacter fetus TaxID=196 RepID=UPI0013D8CA05|nr:hypothetical protein [Campylobacter fetus]